MTKKRIGDLLIDAGLINPLQLRAALAQQKRWGRPLGRTLVEMKMVGEKELLRVLSQQLGIVAIELDKAVINEKTARMLEEEFCRDNELIPFAFHEKGKFLDVAMANPTDPTVFDAIRVKTRCNVRPYLAGPLAIERALSRIFLGHERPAGGSDPSAIFGETLFEFGQGRAPAAADEDEDEADGADAIDVPIDVDALTPLPVSVPEDPPLEPLGPPPLDIDDDDGGFGPLAPLEPVAPPEVALPDPREVVQRLEVHESTIAGLRSDILELRPAIQAVERRIAELVVHLTAAGVLPKEASPGRDRRPTPAVGAPLARERPPSGDLPPAPRLPPTTEMPKAPAPAPKPAPAPAPAPAPKPLKKRSNDLPPVAGTIDVPNVPTGKVVAMDFGTSRSSVATVLDGKVVTVKLEGDWDMPSCVGFAEDGSVLLGHAARDLLATDPRNALPWPKRLLGRKFRDRELEPYLASMSMPCSEGPHGEVLLHVGDKTLTVPEACSHILKRLRLAAEHTINKPVSEVVLTTPVSFDKPQFEGLREAARLAGLRVKEFIDEPVAAAFTNRTHPSFSGLAAVFDFGGGTFDFSVVEVTKSGLSVVISAGDPWLGGDDFDAALANAAANAFWRQTNIELRNQVVQWQRLIIAAERAKLELSAEDETVLRLDQAALTAQGALDLEFEITAAQFARLCRDIIQRSLDTCEESLSVNGLTVNDLNAVYLSGGTSYIPAVREALTKYFGRPPHVTVPPERAVILGAALFAAIIDHKPDAKPA